MPSIQSRNRTNLRGLLWGATALVVLAGASAPVLIDSGVAKAAPRSRAGRPLFVTANLQEGFGDRDVRRMGEMRTFVKRLLNQTPSAPDVLLLQEVRGRSARYVKKLLSNKTGFPYAVAFGCDRAIWRQNSRRIITQDSAILLNKATMDKMGSGGYITTRKWTAEFDKPLYRKHAYGMARMKGTDLTFAMASIHIPGSGVKETSQEIANELASRRPGVNRRSVIGGDFNTLRKARVVNGRVIPARFWKNLTTRPYRYRDSIHFGDGPLSNGVDYIFARAGVHKTGVDTRYNPKMSEDRSGFYSDHRFRWAVLGSDMSPPTSPKSLRASNVTSGIRLSWRRAADRGGSGVAGYEVWRMLESRPDARLVRTKDSSWVHKKTWGGWTYRYYVRTYDWAHNRSARSDKVTLVRRKPN